MHSGRVVGGETNRLIDAPRFVAGKEPNEQFNSGLRDEEFKQTLDEHRPDALTPVIRVHDDVLHIGILQAVSDGTSHANCAVLRVNKDDAGE